MMLVDVGAGVESMVYALAGLAVFRLRRKSRITESTSESSSQTDHAGRHYTGLTDKSDAVFNRQTFRDSVCSHTKPPRKPRDAT